VTTASLQPTRLTKRVLIVDDEPMVTGMLKEAFRAFRHGHAYELVTAHDGATAVLALVRGPFDLILLDMRMPRMDGLETLKQMRALGLQVPVIMITGNENTQDAARALSGGIFAYLPKPFDVRRLECLVALACPSARLVAGGEAPTQGGRG
jgi:CheY-like chemotaxis protein